MSKPESNTVNYHPFVRIACGKPVNHVFPVRIWSLATCSDKLSSKISGSCLSVCEKGENSREWLTRFAIIRESSWKKTWIEKEIKQEKEVIIIIGGHFNAKTHRISNIRITNLFFEHKPIQQIIWQSPALYTTVIDVETAKKSISKPKRLC